MVLQIVDWKHSGLAQSFIERQALEGFGLAGCEVHYNHYGDRGVVDVLLKRSVSGRSLWWVCELKPFLQDIGEAVRQVHRAQTYLRKSRSDLFGEEDELKFGLVLLASDHNWLAYRKHCDLFRNFQVLFHHEDARTERRIRNFQEIFEAMQAVREERFPRLEVSRVSRVFVP